jgi:hypothetical protein
MKIKARAWDYTSKQMVYGVAINENGEAVSHRIFSAPYVKLSLPMLYTGLKDINGVDIYDGDILKCELFDGRFENYEVLWEKNEVCWEAWNIDRSNWIAPRVWGEQEVVGNKYENPDIMAKNALKRNGNIGDNSDGY